MIVNCIIKLEVGMSSAIGILKSRSPGIRGVIG